MKEPAPLKPGATIALVAPSFGCTIEPYSTRLDASIARLKRHGFSIREGKNIRRNDGVCASAPAKERAAEIMAAFASDADLVASVGGGELMSEILPYLGFEAIKKGAPKWFMGFSDNTNLTFLLTILSDLVTVYGPNFPAFYEKKWRNSEKDAIALLEGQRHFEGYPKWAKGKSNKAHPLWGYRLTQKKIITPHEYKRPVKGIMLGGCLDCLIALCGTKYDKVKEFIKVHDLPVIWYLEACDLNPLALRRAYYQLREAGWFDTAGLFLLGRPYSAMEELLGVDRFSAAIDILGPLGKPILIDVDLGHFAPSMPIKNGAVATCKFEQENLIIDYE